MATQQANPVLVKVLAAALLLAAAVFIFRSCTGEEDQASKALSPEEMLDAAARAELLPGFMPYEVIEQLKKEGMQDEPGSGSANYTPHTIKGGINGYEVITNINIRREGSGLASGFMATSIPVTSDQPRDALPFFQFVASAGYEGADPAKAAQWVADNFDQDSANTVIGKGAFLLRANGVSRVLILKNASPEYPNYNGQ